MWLLPLVSVWQLVTRPQALDHAFGNDSCQHAKRSLLCALLLAAAAASGGAHIDLVPYRYLFKVADQQYCLGVFDNGFQGTLLGGIITRNVLVQVSNSTPCWRGLADVWERPYKGRLASC
jgi:hypothetical protein